LLDEYRSRELHTRYSAWSGQEVYRGDKEVELGYFGGGSDAVFAGSPRALDSISTFSTMRIAGTTAYTVGLGLLITDLVLLATGSNAVVGRDAQGDIDSVKPLGWGLLIGGTVLGIGGGVAMQGANAYLSDAVDQYNEDLANRLKAGAGDAHGRRAFMSIRGAF
jgi:hypothetical protein